MRLPDLFRLTLRTVFAQRLRSALTLLGIAVGIMAVMLLTSIGEGVHQYVLQQFAQFGTNIVQVTPGRTATGGAPQGLPSTVRPLTLEDVAVLGRLPDIEAATPLVWGNAEMETGSAAGARVRRTTLYGVSADSIRVFASRVSLGRYLPPDDAGSARAFVVLGERLRRELFGNANPLGERVRIAGQHFRVIGVLSPKGQFLGTDLDDTAFVPAAQALALFNREGLMRIDLVHAPQASPAAVAAGVRTLLAARHGREDFTLITQEDMLRSLSKILDVLTAAVSAIGAISLLVGGVGIVTIMSIAVAERTAEIGLMMALGARARSILAMFLAEAVALAVAGGILGLVGGGALVLLLRLAIPALPLTTPLFFVLLALGVSALIGLLAGVLPARRAARLDPVEALRSE